MTALFHKRLSPLLSPVLMSKKGVNQVPIHEKITLLPQAKAGVWNIQPAGWIQSVEVLHPTLQATGNGGGGGRGTMTCCRIQILGPSEHGHWWQKGEWGSTQSHLSCSFWSHHYLPSTAILIAATAFSTGPSPATFFPKWYLTYKGALWPGSGLQHGWLWLIFHAMNSSLTQILNSGQIPEVWGRNGISDVLLSSSSPTGWLTVLNAVNPDLRCQILPIYSMAKVGI